MTVAGWRRIGAGWGMAVGVIAVTGVLGCGGSKPALEPEITGSPGPAPVTEEKGPEKGLRMVRVAILTGVTEVQIGATDSYSLLDEVGVILMGTSTEVMGVRRDGSQIVVYTASGELIDSVDGSLAVELHGQDGELTVNGARYPGRLEIRPGSKDGFHVINLVDVETYLRGVVPLEIGVRAEAFLEAAKAQAVAARTYVAAHLGKYAEEGFDLYAGVTDQVYGPVDRRHPDADLAVAQTRGLILAHEGRPITANYASTCGGRTAGAEESFETDPVPYLKSHEDVVDGVTCCRTSRYYRWEETWTEPELRRVLAKTVPRVTGKPWVGSFIDQLNIADKGKSGRVVRLRIVTDETYYDVTKGRIRQVLETTGGRALPSTSFELEIFKKENRIRMIVAQGRGWGHGVGMCQWGAMQLSQDGYGFRKILDHYYPGTELKDWREVETMSGTVLGPEGRGGRG